MSNSPGAEFWGLRVAHFALPVPRDQVALVLKSGSGRSGCKILPRNFSIGPTLLIIGNTIVAWCVNPNPRTSVAQVSYRSGDHAAEFRRGGRRELSGRERLGCRVHGACQISEGDLDCSSSIASVSSARGNGSMA